MNTVASGLCPDINYRVTHTMGAAIEDLVLFKNAQRERIHERILRVAPGEINFAADSGNAEAISVKRNSTDNALEDPPVLLLVEWTEAQAVHCRDGPCAHGKDVAKDSSDSGGSSLEGLYKRRMVVRFDLECDSQPVTDIDNTGVLSRALQHRRSLCWQSPQVNTRALI